MKLNSFIAPVALAAGLLLAPIAQPTRRCSTSPTIRRASCTRTSTPRSPSTGRRRPAKGRRQAIARRLRQAGAHGDRWPRSRRRDAGARLRHRRDRREGQADAGRLAEAAAATTARPTPRRSCSSCARAIPKAIKDWDDLVKPGVSRDHAESEDLGRRALELSRRMGICASANSAATPRRRTSSRGSTGTCRCSIPARAARRRLRRARRRRRASSPGKTRPSSPEGVRPGQVRDRRAVAVASSPSRRSRSSTRSSTSRARARWPRLSGVSVLATKARRSRRSNFYRPTTAKVAAKYARPVSQARRCSRSTRPSAAGRRRTKTHFADGGTFDQIYAPPAARRPCTADRQRRRASTPRPACSAASARNASCCRASAWLSATRCSISR